MLNKWYVICSALIVIIAAQSILYFDLSNKYANAFASYQTLLEENNDLSLQAEELSGEYSLLVSNLTSLSAQYSTLMLDYSRLTSQYTDILQEFTVLQTNYTDLETVVRELQADYASLQDSYASLQNSYASMETQFNLLKTDYSDLSEDYDSLELQYDDLLSQYTGLQENYALAQLQYTLLEDEYNRYVSAYETLRDTVNQRLWLLARVKSFITPQDSAVSAIVYTITGNWSDHSDFNEYWTDLKAMYLWIRNNIEYRYDGLSPMLPYDPSNPVYYYEDMWQFPNETLDLERGDCDDQAILLCSMIRCYSNMEYSTECIWISSSTASHLAVQVLVEGDKLVIFDPAGNYYSHDVFTGKIVFNDINLEINKWLNYWKPQIGNDVHVHRVFSDDIDETFLSTDAYVTWMYSR